jgi:hypothetical protein
MTRQEIESLLKMLAAMERKKLELVMQAWRGFDCYGTERRLAKDFPL